MNTRASTLLTTILLAACTDKRDIEANWDPMEEASEEGSQSAQSADSNVTDDSGSDNEETDSGATPESPDDTTDDVDANADDADATATDEWTVADQPPTDILMYIDQSCSMEDNHALLREQTTTFIESIESYSDDWQLIIANQDNGCNQTEGVLGPSETDYVSRFQTAVGEGGGWWTEAGLTITSQAVEMTDDEECNAGFLRDDALLHIIMMSDESEQSTSSWNWYADKVVAKKGSSSLVKFSAIAGPYPGGCESADPGDGYHQAVAATGGLFLSICDAWATPDNLRRMAEASTLQSSYELSQVPEVDSITVWVNGVRRTSGWGYDEHNNTVNFEAPLPAPGAEIAVRYTPLSPSALH